jgi:3D-(3,5/4)-trihydroxycyclohexane-1,2-dione acylhydrolase (decyclizing)
VIRILNEESTPTVTIVHAAGGLPGDLHKLWHTTSEDQYHAEYGYSCMGYEIAGALGVKLARPEREVIALVGDGSYLMMHGEIVTAIQEGVRLTIVLVDNGGYRCIRSLQQGCGGDAFGNDFRRRNPASGRLDGEVLPIDYAANARSLGASAYRVRTAGELRDALARARGEGRLVLIHVCVIDGPPVPGYAWWDVPISETASSASASAARARYDAERGNQRRSF